MKLIQFNSGIYCIYNEESQALYIGQCENFTDRYNSHLSELKAGAHPNIALQEYTNRVGIDALFFVPIFACHKNDLDINEARFISFLRPAFNQNHNGGLKLSLQPTRKQADDIQTLLYQKFSNKTVSFDEIREHLTECGLKDLTKKRIGMSIKLVKRIRNRDENNKIYYVFNSRTQFLKYDGVRD